MVRLAVIRAAELWRRIPSPARAAIEALALLAIALLPLGVPGLQLGGLPPRVPPEVGVVLTAFEVVPLAIPRLRPSVTLAVVWAAFIVAEITGASTGLGGLALLIALYLVAAHHRRGRGVTAAVVVLVYSALCVVLHLEGSRQRLIDWITFAAVLAVPWFIGELVRRRAAAQAERVVRAADDAIRAQRATLARELHDVVTHHVTAMVVQAESALYLDAADVGERDRTLSVVGETGRLALTELRTLLDALDPATIAGDAPRTAPDDIVAMIVRLRDAGYPIDLDAPAALSLPDDERSVVLRSVTREAVTNAMKHARGQRVSISLRAAPLEVRVQNPLGRAGTAPISGGGRGLAGMSRSVEQTGGVFSAGPHPDARAFVVSARWES